MGFRLNFKWGCFSPTTVSSRYCKGKDSLCFLTRLSALYGETEPLTYSSSCHLPENYFLGTRDIKVVARQGSIDDLHENGVELLNNVDIFHNFSPQLRLLMKNLDILESMFTDSNAMRLEKDILEKLERLGAIHLFNSCLSKTLRSASSSCTTPVDNVFEELQSNVNIVEEVIIRTGKKELRKLKRKGSFHLGIRKSVREFQNSESKPPSTKTMLRSKNKRQKVAKSEADMANGVKFVAELERIRRILEEESGQIANFSTWAEAAGIEREELQRRLHYGLRCRAELIKSSRSLVVYISKNYWGLGIAIEDLIQAGSIAVLHGAERFDKSKGYKFSTYVQYWIRKYMSMLVTRHARGVRIPGTLSKVINQVQNARKALCTSNGKYPCDSEISRFTGLSVEKIRSASRCLRVVGSIDRKIGDSEGIKFMEILSDESIESPEKMVIREEMVKEINKVLKGLKVIEQQVLVLRYGVGNKRNERKSLDEIGKILCVSKEWVRKVEKRGLLKLRNQNCLKILSHYVNYI